MMWVARPRRGPTGATVSVSGEELEDKLGRVFELSLTPRGADLHHAGSAQNAMATT